MAPGQPPGTATPPAADAGRWDERARARAERLSAACRSGAASLIRRGLCLSLRCAEREADGGAGTHIATPLPLPDGLAGRGVLLDLPRAERRAALAPGEAVGAERLDACAERLGVTIEPGDLLLLRTGRGALEPAAERDHRGASNPGLAPGSARWLLRREIALIASDQPALEAASAPGGTSAGAALAREAPGVLLGIGFGLEALARACAEDGNHAFLLVVPPLRATGANPADPLALK